jgi:hypothetical protein
MLVTKVIAGNRVLLRVFGVATSDFYYTELLAQQVKVNKY